MYHKTRKQKSLKKILVLALCFIAISGTNIVNADDKKITFHQALEQVYKNNGTLKASKAIVEKTKYMEKAAQGLYYPKIWMDGKYTHINDEIVIDLNGIRSVMGKLHGVPPQILPSFTTKVQKKAFSNANINFSWMIFTGGKITAANKAAGARVTGEQEQYFHNRSMLTTELAKRYYGYLVAMDAVKVYKLMTDAIDQHLSQTKELEKYGIIARSEKIHAEAALAEALRKYKKSIRKVKIARAGLNNILSSKTDIDPVSPLFLTKKIDRLTNYIKSARLNNHILKGLAAKEELAIQGYKAELGAQMPDIYCFGKYELYKKNLTLLDPEWAVGIGVSFPLFEGFSKTNKIMAAKKQKQAITFFKQKAVQDICTLVEKKYNELMMEIEQFEALNTSLKFANENLRVNKLAYKSGIKTSLDVVDAQLAVSQIKIERLNTMYKFDISLAELLEVCGASRQYEKYQNYNDVEVKF